jgi:hypothetical protein
MSQEISAITWASKDRSFLLERSVRSFQDAIRRNGLNLPLFVAGPENDAGIDGLTVIDKHRLCEHLISKTKWAGVSPETIRFALLGCSESIKNHIVDTGTNRNALLLTLMDKHFLCVDDDVVCKFADMKENIGEDAVFDPRLRSLISIFFNDRDECYHAVSYDEDPPLVDFLSAHKKLLDWHKIDPGSGKVVATVSGIHGDSGFGSPRSLFLSKINQLELYENAIKNRLILRYTSIPVATDNPRFQAVCTGFDNTMMLPPFLPIGRNQDGVFGVAIKACLPRALIGHVPWVIRHDPVPAREYPDGEMRIWRFRISEMMSIFLESFYKLHAADNQSEIYDRYESVGRYLEQFAGQEPNEFISSLRRLCMPNLDIYTDYLRKISISRTDAPTALIDDAIGCIDYIEHIKNDRTFCIPEELLSGSNLADAIKSARDLTFKYGTLLRHWPAIRTAAANR